MAKVTIEIEDQPNGELCIHFVDDGPRPQRPVRTGKTMIDIQSPLSPVLAALLMREFTNEQIGEWAALQLFDAARDKEQIERFTQGLEEHRLSLRGDGRRDEFCSVLLVYLEALLDPGTDALKRSGIEITASAATITWDRMTDVQRTALWQEASKLHAVIEPLIA